MQHARAKNPRAGQGPQRLETDRFATATRKRLSAPALRTFLAIADFWGLNEEQRLLVLGYPSRSTYHNWAKQAREHGVFTLDVDTLDSNLCRAWYSSGARDPISQRTGGCRVAPDAALCARFRRHPPLDILTNGTQDGLMTVRRFLDAARGGVYMQPNTLDEAFTPYDDGDIVFR